MKRAQALLKTFAALSSIHSSALSLPPSLSSFSRLFFSSHSHSPSDESTPPSTDDLTADVTTQELKQRIDKYLSGDAEALPSIFEAILARKLNGNHEGTDDELMDEFRSKISHDDEDEVSDSDDDSSDTGDDLSD